MTRLQFTCAKKLYRSWKHAAHDASELRRKGQPGEAPYYCRRCQAWHVGASVLRKVKA